MILLKNFVPRENLARKFRTPCKFGKKISYPMKMWQENFIPHEIVVNYFCTLFPKPGPKMGNEQIKTGGKFNLKLTKFTYFHQKS